MTSVGVGFITVAADLVSPGGNVVVNPFTNLPILIEITETEFTSGGQSVFQTVNFSNRIETAGLEFEEDPEIEEIFGTTLPGGVTGIQFVSLTNLPPFALGDDDDGGGDDGGGDDGGGDDGGGDDGGGDDGGDNGGDNGGGDNGGVDDGGRCGLWRRNPVLDRCAPARYRLTDGLRRLRRGYPDPVRAGKPDPWTGRCGVGCFAGARGRPGRLRHGHRRPRRADGRRPAPRERADLPKPLRPRRRRLRRRRRPARRRSRPRRPRGNLDHSGCLFARVDDRGSRWRARGRSPGGRMAGEPGRGRASGAGGQVLIAL